MTFGPYNDRPSGCGCLAVIGLIVFLWGVMIAGLVFALVKIVLPFACLLYAFHLCLRKKEDPLDHLTLDMDERRVKMLYKGEVLHVVGGKRPLRLKSSPKLLGDGK